jgi:protein tyrosine phosphatase (PTP) superfamily phosphohydrolase (DUF442 family)
MLFVALLHIVGCHGRPGPSKQEEVETTASAAVEAAPVLPTLLADDLPGLHNVLGLGDGCFSGSEPEGDAGFSSLASLGIRTIVSVDGARPDIETARKNGMKYVHVPIGYAGVSKQAGLALVRIAREPAGPIFIHCHHGRHRGPAAAAIVCIATGKMQPRDALKILELAGTGKEYAGLWRDVETFSLPPLDTALPELDEVATVTSLVTAMASVDRYWDGVKACRDANWQTPHDHPDLTPAQESLLLREALHEARRMIPDDKFDDAFRSRLDEAESMATRIEFELNGSRHDEAEKQMRLLEESCKQCHAKYRN